MNTIESLRIPLNTIESLRIPVNMIESQRIPFKTIQFSLNPMFIPRCYIHLRWRFFVLTVSRNDDDDDDTGLRHDVTGVDNNDDRDIIAWTDGLVPCPA